MPWAVVGGLVAIALVAVGLRSAGGADERPESGWAQVAATLDAQAAALVRGDEQGWLAALAPGDPAREAAWRLIFTNLRAMGVSSWSYHDAGAASVDSSGSVWVDVVVCYRQAPCPQYVKGGQGVIPMKLTLAPDQAGGYRITSQKPKVEGSFSAIPWITDALAVAQGDRVTVLTSAADRGRLAGAVRLADRAAKVTDRFADLAGGRDFNYRIYLAGKAEWSRWFAEPDPLASGYAVGGDVVVKLADWSSDGAAEELLRHELGHVATLQGIRGKNTHMWASEGLAEHIAADARTRTAARAEVRGMRPRPVSIAMETAGNRTAKQAGQFYAHGLLAVDCLVRSRGQKQTVDFVRRLSAGEPSLEAAAQQAFGKPWSTVDRECVADIRKAVD